MGSKNDLQVHRLSNMVETEEECNNGGSRINNKGEKEDLYSQLWHACAGPLVNVPSVGDKVFYFPQGHIEQVEAYTSQDGKEDMPVYDLPSKILCKVVYVQLKAESATDEVFAQITLLPEQEGTSPESETSSESMPQKFNVCYFSKRLTPSDTSTHGGFSVPKRHADECFPLLDMCREPPAQELVAKDLHGSEWRFRHIYRGHPKRHLLTSGWSTFVAAKKLVAGDACIFLRGENGELFIGVLRAKQQANMSASVISGHSMQHGILASAFHAMKTITMFTVYHRPWTSSAEFIVPHDQYMKSAEIDFSVGTRFRMQFEGEGCLKSKPPRIAGTVVGIDNIDPIRWADSDWRCLKVEWDVRSTTSVPPQKVSPWSIEPTDVKKKKIASLLPNCKRACTLNPSSPGFPVLAGGSLLKSPVDCAQKRQSGVLQGQKIRAMHACELGASGQQPLLTHSFPQPNPVRMHDPFRHSHGSAIATPGGNPPNPKIASYQPPMFLSFGAHDCIESSPSLSLLKASSTNSASQDWRAPKEKKDVTGAPTSQANENDKFMLFGVNIFSSPVELPSNQIVSSRKHYSPCPSHISEPSNGISGYSSEKQCKNNCSSFANRSCTKVLKHGTALGRSVDLSRFDGYVELIRELDQMFDFEGALIHGGSGWYLTYMDGEGDMMLIGDYPWPEFQGTVRKMYICPKEDADKLDPSSPNPTIPSS